MTLWLGVPDPPAWMLAAVAPPVTHTINPGQNLPVLPAGSHARLAAGTHTQFTGDLWTLNGTLAAPIFISADPAAIIDCNSSTSAIRPRGAFFVFEGLRFFRTRVSFGDDPGANASDYVIRDCESWGLVETGNGTNFTLRASKRALALRNHVHDNGTPSASEPGCNGFTVSGVDGSGVPGQDIWILDGLGYRQRGDNVRIGRPTGEIPERIYISGNHFWEDPTRPDNAIGENAIDVKLSRDIILSRNLIQGFRSTPTSPGEGIVIHDNASWVWALDNVISFCQQGIATTSGTNVFYLGNFIQAMSDRGFRLTGNVVATHNTIRDCPIGMYSSGTPGTIIANLINGCPQVFSMPSGGTISHNITSGDPLFTGPFTDVVQAGSPVKDAGIVGPGYAAFQSRYGFSIEPVWNGAPDVGSYEIPGGGQPPSAPTLALEVQMAVANLDWTQPSGGGAVVNYEVLRAVDGGGPVILATLGPSILSYDDATIEVGHQYDFSVRASNLFGVALSNVAALDTRVPLAPVLSVGASL